MELNETVLPFEGIPVSLPVSAGLRVDSALLPLEGGTDPAFGKVRWKTLFSSDVTQTSDMVLGIAQFDAGDTLEPHRHAPSEFYFGLSGSGEVMIDGVAHSISAGVALFIPANAEHGVVAGPEGLSFAYGFPRASFAEVEYQFSAARAD